MIRLISLLVGLLFATSVFSAVFCATTSTELQDHLDTAESNDEDDVILLQVGTYVGNFDFFGEPDEAFSLTLEGGFVPFGFNSCGQRVSINPSDTVIDGNLVNRTLQIVGAGGSSASIRSIAFVNGAAPPAQSGGGGWRSLARHQPTWSRSISKTCFFREIWQVPPARSEFLSPTRCGFETLLWRPITLRFFHT